MCGPGGRFRAGVHWCNDNGIFMPLSWFSLPAFGTAKSVFIRCVLVILVDDSHLCTFH